MDIVAALAAQLEVEEATAAGVAGGLLLLVEDLVLERVDYGAAGKMRKALPELTGWQSSAPTIAPGQFSLGSLPTPKATGDEREVAGVLSRYGVPESAAPRAVELVMQFLVSRLDPKLLATVTAAVPMLKRAQ